MHAELGAWRIDELQLVAQTGLKRAKQATRLWLQVHNKSSRTTETLQPAHQSFRSHRRCHKALESELHKAIKQVRSGRGHTTCHQMATNQFIPAHGITTYLLRTRLCVSRSRGWSPRSSRLTGSAHTRQSQMSTRHAIRIGRKCH